MPNTYADDTKGFNGLTRSELIAFRVTSVLAGSLLMLVVWFFLPRLLVDVLELPEGVWFGLGMLLMFVSLQPFERMQARLAQPPRVVSMSRLFLAAVVGSLVSGLLFTLMQPWM